MAEDEQQNKDEQYKAEEDDTSEIPYISFSSQEEVDLFMKNLLKPESEKSKTSRRRASEMLSKTRVRTDSSLNDRQKAALELLKKAKRPK